MKWFLGLAVFMGLFIGIASADLSSKNSEVELTATTPEAIAFTIEADAKPVSRMFYVRNLTHGSTAPANSVVASIEASVGPNTGWTPLYQFTTVGTNEAYYHTFTTDTQFPYWRVRFTATGTAGLTGSIATPEAFYYGVSY